MAKESGLKGKNPKQKVKVCKDGPYLVSGGIPLSEQVVCVDPDNQCHGWREGKKYDVPENYALCRCGKSARKPFCDGTHAKASFDGTETASREPYLKQAKETRGEKLKLTDAESYCAGIRFCQRAGGTWKLTEQSAIPEARQTAIEEACECPSGRLVVWGEDGEAIEPVLEPSIALINDQPAGVEGPIWVRGGIPIESADGATYEIRNRVTLCRCGKSRNKPFCDGSHMD